MVYEEVDNPDRQYTGIAALLGTIQGRSVTNYYVTATGIDKKDNQVLIFPEKFDVRFPNALALEPNGLGILSASLPSGITALRDFSTDFIFCMINFIFLVLAAFKKQPMRMGAMILLSWP